MNGEREPVGLYKAFTAFYQNLLSQECEHPRVGGYGSSHYCPDCGYKVTLMWTLIKCQQCSSKRIPKKGLDGHVEPLHKYCRYCGSSAYRLVKKDKIEAYELMYGLMVKEIDYREERQVKYESAPPPKQNRLDIVEGEVIRKRYYHQHVGSSQWQEVSSPSTFDQSVYQRPKKQFIG